jgi:hypothetical protein
MESVTVKELIISNEEHTWKISIAPQGPNLCIWHLNESGYEFIHSFVPHIKKD